MWGVWVSMSGRQGHCGTSYNQPIRISLALYWPIRGQVLAHLIVTENCISLFLRQKVSSQTSSLCCHCHCGILNKHRHLDKFDIIEEPQDDLHYYSARLRIPEMSLIVSSSSSSSVTSFISSKTWKSSRISPYPDDSVCFSINYFSVADRCFGQNKQSSCYEWGTSLSIIIGWIFPTLCAGWLRDTGSECATQLSAALSRSQSWGDVRRGVARITRGEDLLTICTSSPEANYSVLLILSIKLKKPDLSCDGSCCSFWWGWYTWRSQGWHFPCVLHHIVPSLCGIPAAWTILLEDAVSEMSEPRAPESDVTQAIWPASPCPHTHALCVPECSQTTKALILN